MFDAIRSYFEEHDSGHGTIFVFVPYIKTNVPAKLLDGFQNRIVVVTAWEPSDIQSGSSELKLYPFCKRNRITPYVGSGLHLKAYSANLNRSILAIGNVSCHGLLPRGNYEAGWYS